MPVVLEVALVCLLPTAAGWLLVSTPRVWRFVAERVRARRAEQLLVRGAPIEKLAADLRRLQRLLEQAGPEVPALRRRAASLAYEDRLLEACRALEVEPDLDGRTGLSRAAELLRIEAALRDAGLQLRRAA